LTPGADNTTLRVMAYLRIIRRGKAQYHYIVESYRAAGTVRQRILEYLGDAPEPARLKRALTYWRVKPKGGKR